MSVAVSSQLRRRTSVAKMPQSTNEFSGIELQHCDRSPTATPAQTRSGSPMRGTPMPHTVIEAVRFMNDLHETAEKDAPEKLFTVTPGKAMASVGQLDGSEGVSKATKMKFLAVYFFFNLSLTLYNKAVMIQVCLPFIRSGFLHLPSL